MKLKSCIAIFFILTFQADIFAQPNILRPVIAGIADSLRQEQLIHFGYPVGIGGWRETDNRYYQLYLKLNEEATDAELVQLSGDSTKSLVIYSFDILSRRQYPGLKWIYLQHRNDTTDFWIAEGCMGIEDKVNWFMLRCLNPAIKNRKVKYMTKEEFDLHLKRFKQSDNSFY
jgi:hypothetical protein